MRIYDDEKQINPHYLKLINAFGDIKYWINSCVCVPQNNPLMSFASTLMHLKFLIDVILCFKCQLLETKE